MRREVLYWLSAYCLVLSATAVHAQVPQLIRYQGTLVDANNVPIEGAVILTFRLYEAATGGTAVWTETQQAIAVSRGVFNVLLGQVTPLTLMFEKDYWLSTQVNTDVEMSPRQRLTSVPYAYRAQVAERLAEQPPGFEVDAAGTLASGLVAYWKLEETSGTRADSKGSNTLADTNTVTQAAGKKGNAAQFTAANSEYLSVADNADLSTGDIDFTVACWLYLDSASATADKMAVTKADSTNNAEDEYRLYRASAADNGVFRFTIRNAGSAVPADLFGPAGAGVWYFVVAWHDAARNTINIQVNNGGVNSTATGSVVPPDSTSSFRIGGVETPTINRWDGRIDEVGFWKRVLTAQERADLYNAGAGNTHLPGGFYVDSPLTGKRYRLVTEEVPLW